jgi:hypothetical protein
LNIFSNDVVSNTFRSVVPLASEGHVSPRSRYWSLGDEAVSDMWPGTARQLSATTNFNDTLLVERYFSADAKTPTIALFALAQARAQSAEVGAIEEIVNEFENFVKLSCSLQMLCRNFQAVI